MGFMQSFACINVVRAGHKDTQRIEYAKEHGMNANSLDAVSRFIFYCIKARERAVHTMVRGISPCFSHTCSGVSSQ
jgi:hypothetical protein